VGFLKSGRLVGFNPYLLDLAPDDRRTIYLGIRGTLNFMVVLVPIFGGVFIDLLGFYFTFLMVSMIMFIAFYLNFNQNSDCKDNFE
jgi:MFS family permease